MTAFRRTSLEPRRAAIVGSRHINDYRTFCTHIRPLILPTDIIVSGASEGGGIDILARRFARQNSHRLVEFPVDHTLIAKYEADDNMDRRAAYGRAAGDRNQQIVNYLTDPRDIMIAIRCQHSTGTPDTIARMTRRLRNLDIDPQSHSILRLYSYLWDCTEHAARRQASVRSEIARWHEIVRSEASDED